MYSVMLCVHRTSVTGGGERTALYPVCCLYLLLSKGDPDNVESF